MSCILLSKLEK